MASAVVEQAIHDYKKALKQNDTSMIYDCERFFKNESIFSIYCDYNGETIMNLVKRTI